MKRIEQLQKMQQVSEWDFVVIGGGASGLGAALDAAARGFKTILFESHDFAKGTSSRSTKLVHGGVRYMAQGDIGLVKAALRERGLLAQNAGHLVKNQSFVIPNYSFWGGPYYMLGLSMYDMLAGSLSLGKTQYINKKETLDRLPTIESSGLSSGVVYRDGQFDDARLSVNIAQTAVENGACMLNYTPVIGLLKDANGKVNGVKVKDAFSGNIYEVQTKAVINATGVFTNDIMDMDNDGKKQKFVVPSQGIHLVFDREFLPSDYALMIPKTSDGRVLFAVPWHNKVVVGTTDTLIDSPSWEPKALEKEIEFVLETVNRFFVKKAVREDVRSVFAGLRPLAAPKDGGTKTKEVSRSHKIITSHSGLVTITGGKWTTYREMAEEVVDEAIKVNNLEHRDCKTTHMSIHGNMPTSDADRKNHLYIYGTDIPNIQKMWQEDPAMAEKLHSRFNNTVAEVVWAARYEMAQTVEDVLSRRVRLLFLDARAAIDCAEKVATILAKELGHDSAWIETQTKEFIELAKGYLLVDYSPNKA